MPDTPSNVMTAEELLSKYYGNAPTAQRPKTENPWGYEEVDYNEALKPKAAPAKVATIPAAAPQAKPTEEIPANPFEQAAMGQKPVDEPSFDFDPTINPSQKDIREYAKLQLNKIRSDRQYAELEFKGKYPKREPQSLSEFITGAPKGQLGQRKKDIDDYIKKSDALRRAEEYLTEVSKLPDDEATLSDYFNIHGKNLIANVITAGYYDMAKGLTDVFSSRRVAKGKGTPEDSALIEARGLKEMGESGMKTTNAYDFAQMAGGSIPFMESIFATGGMGALGGKSALKLFREGGMKAIGKESVNIAKQGALRAIILPHTRTMQELAGKVTIDDEGEWMIDPETMKPLWKGIAIGTYSNFTAFTSEAMGGLMGGGAVGSLLKKYKVSPSIPTWWRTLTKAVGLHSITGEIGEEFLNNAMDAPINDQSVWEALSENAWQTTWQTGLFTAMLGMTATPGTIANARTRGTNKKIIDLYGKETISSLRTALENGDEKTYNSLFNSAVNGMLTGIKGYDENYQAYYFKEHLRKAGLTEKQATQGLFKYTSSLAMQKIYDKARESGNSIIEANKEKGAVDQMNPVEKEITLRGRKIKFGDTPLEEDKNPMIVFADTKHGQKVILKKAVSDGAKDGFISYDVKELKVNNFDTDKVDPKFLVGTDIKERKDVPYEEWLANEVNEYNLTNQQNNDVAATEQSPYQPGQQIEFKGQKLQVVGILAKKPGEPESYLEVVDESGSQFGIPESEFNLITGDKITQPTVQDQQKTGQNEAAPPQTEGIQQPQEPLPGEEPQLQPQKPQVPLNKEGLPDYDNITDPVLYAEVLSQEFGEDTSGVLSGLIEDANTELKKAESAKNAIERARKLKSAKIKLAHLAKVSEVINGVPAAAPAQEAAQPTNEGTATQTEPVSSEASNNVVVPDNTTPESSTEPERSEPVNNSQPESGEVSDNISQTAVNLTAANGQVNANPTDAQKEAGNYKHGHITIQGLDISIENPAGSIRKGTDSKGNDWAVLLNNSYGYFKRTEGKDGDQVDVFIGDNLGSDKVYVVDQVNPETGLFDEGKVMLGFNSETEAEAGYDSNYSPGWRGMGAITEMNIDDFKKWLGDGKRTKIPVDPSIPVTENKKQEQPATPGKTQKQPGKIKSQSRTGKVLSNPANSFTESVLQFFVGGGKISREDFTNLSGLKGKDQNAYFPFLSNDGVRLDLFHESVENSFGMEDKGPMDMANEVIDVLLTYATKGKMLAELEKRQDITGGMEATSDEVANDYTPEVSIKETNPEGVNNFMAEILTDSDIMDIFGAVRLSDGSRNSDFLDKKNNIDWNKLSAALESGPTYFTQFPYGLNQQQLETLKSITNETGQQGIIEKSLTERSGDPGESEGDIAERGHAGDQTGIQGGESGQVEQPGEPEVTPEKKKPIYVGELFQEQPKQLTDSQIEQNFRNELENNYEKYKQEYISKFGYVIGGDNAKELSPDYRNNRTRLAGVVHEPASEFAKKLFEDVVSSPLPEGVDDVVLFTAGGTGAGKTTAVKDITADKKPIVYDSNMSGVETSSHRIDFAKENGKHVMIVYAWRDPFEAFINGVLPRMRREGRSVSIENHINTHVKALATFRKIYDLYKDDPDVDFRIIDTDNETNITTNQLYNKEINYESLKKQLEDETRSERSRRWLTTEEEAALLRRSVSTSQAESNAGEVPEGESGKGPQESSGTEPLPGLQQVTPPAKKKKSAVDKLNELLFSGIPEKKPKPAGNLSVGSDQGTDKNTTFVNEKGEIDYGALERTISAIEQGVRQIHFFPNAVERGRIKGGRKAVAASLLIGSNAGTNKTISAQSQEQILEDYFSHINTESNPSIYSLPDALNNRSEEFVDVDSAEAIVFLNENSQSVTKFIAYKTKSDSPFDFINNRITLHNYLFPSDAYTLKGIAKNNDVFYFVVEQPFAFGKPTDGENRKVFYEFMDRNGWKENPDKLYSFRKGLIEIDDLHEDNVLLTTEGNFRFIDTEPKFLQEGMTFNIVDVDQSVDISQRDVPGENNGDQQISIRSNFDKQLNANTGLNSQVEDLKRKLRDVSKARDAKKAELAMRLVSQKSMFEDNKPAATQATMFDNTLDASVENIKAILREYDFQIAGLQDAIKKLETTLATASKENQGQQSMFRVTDELYFSPVENAQKFIDRISNSAWNDLSLLHERAGKYIAKNGVYSQSQPKEDWNEGISFISERAVNDGAGQYNLWGESDYSATPDNNNVTYLERILTNRKGLTFAGDQLTGAGKIKNSDDVAFLFKNLENAASENFFTVFVDKDGNYKVLYTSTGGISGTVTDLRFIVAGAKEFNADKVFLVHNHPSGNLQPSDADIVTTKRIQSALDSLSGIQSVEHVIINLDSGSYALIRDYHETVELDKEEYAKKNEITPVDVYQFDKQVLYVPVSERTKISGAADVARYLSKMKRGSTPKLNAIILDRSNIINKYLLYDEGISNETLVKELAYEASKHGGAVILSSNTKLNVDFLHSLKYNLGLADIDLLDVLIVKQNEDITKNYKSYADEGLLYEPSSEYSNEVRDNQGNYSERPQGKDFQFPTDYLDAMDEWRKSSGEKSNLLKSAAEMFEEKSNKRSLAETLNGMRQYIQDKDLPVRDFEQEILRRGGKQDNGSKPYRDISLSFGRQQKLYEDFAAEKMEPINKTIVKITKAARISPESVIPYVISKHAPENNAYMREVKAKEWGVKHPGASQGEINNYWASLVDTDYSGIMPLDREHAFTNPEDLAHAITDEFEAEVPPELIRELWDNIRSASGTILDTWESGKRMSLEQKKEYATRFKYFVPLRGWQEGDASELTYTRGYGISNSLKHREGRKSLAQNPFAHIQNVAFKAISEQVDNEVKTAMLKLLTMNLGNNEIHEMATIKKLYYVKVYLPDGSYEWEATIDRPSQDMFDSGDATTKIYNEYARLRTPMQAKEHEVIVHRDGGDVVMILKGKNLPVAQVLNGQNNMFRLLFTNKMLDASKNGWLIDAASVANRFMKATMTSFNVVFPATNFVRDAGEATLTQYIKGESGIKVLGNYRKSFPAMVRHLAGKSDMNNETDQLLNRFYNAGGATGYTHSSTIEEVDKDLRRDIERHSRAGTLKGRLKNSPHNIVKAIEYWNRLFEDATRFSVFYSSVKSGKTDQDAAIDAKEASLNFNRKGKGSKSWDALYAFFNVAFQGAQKNIHLAKNYPARFTKVALAITTLGFLEALMNAATDDPDDPEGSYYNINPYMRENYLILPNLPKIIAGESKGDKYLSIPLPQFWRAFKSIGSITYDVTHGKMKAGEGVMKGFSNLITSLTPFDVGGFSNDGKFSWAPLIPTIIKPAWEVKNNQNYMGFKISNEPFTKAQEKSLAESGLGKKNVNPAIKFLTDGLFRWGGGDSRMKGFTDIGSEAVNNEGKVPSMLDWNPSKIEHIIKGYTGGTGAVISDLFTTVSQVYKDGEEVDFKNVPLINKFLRDTPQEKWAVISKWYDLKEVADNHKALLSNYRRDAEGENKNIDKYEAADNNPYYSAYVDIFKDAEDDIDYLCEEGNIFEDEKLAGEVNNVMRQTISDIEELNKQFKIKK